MESCQEMLFHLAVAAFCPNVTNGQNPLVTDETAFFYS